MRLKIILIIWVLLFLSGSSYVCALEYTSSNLRDPFESLLPREAEKATSDIKPPALKVEGLVWGTDKPQAIINSTVVKLGEEIGGAKVIDINKNGVTVLFEGRLFELKPVKKSGVNN